MEEIKDKPTKKSNFYLDPIEFRTEIILSKEQDALTNKAVQMFITMCNEVAKTRSYKFEQDREDCVAFALEDCVRYWRGYNPEKSEFAFAYFTRLVMNGLAKGWKKLYNIKSINKISLSHTSLYNI